MSRKQCKSCPWRKDADPDREIPGGYSRELHCKLRETVKTGPASLFAATLPIMACHLTPTGAELPCVGWLVNQIGPGNNLGIRMAVALGKISGDVETIGPQHDTLEQTIPKGPAPKRRRA